MIETVAALDKPLVQLQKITEKDLLGIYRVSLKTMGLPSREFSRLKTRSTNKCAVTLHRTFLPSRSIKEYVDIVLTFLLAIRLIALHQCVFCEVKALPYEIDRCHHRW